MVTLIAAVTQPQLGIGRDGQMLYHIPEDLKRFKSLTMGHPVVMGRKTFESLPNGPLPGRTNIVVSRHPEWKAEGVLTAGSVPEAMRLAEQAEGGDHVYVIGGGEVFAHCLLLADELELTLIEDAETPEADTFFPYIDVMEWQLAAMPEAHQNPGETLAYTFATFRRRPYTATGAEM